MERTLDFIAAIRTAVGVVVVCGVIVAMYWMAIVFPDWMCRRSAGVMGLEGKFVGFAGCYVQTPGGRWVPESAVRYDIKTDTLR